MPSGNETIVTEFGLVGFPTSKKFQLLLFVLFFSFYIVTNATNLFIIMIVIIDRCLHQTPMYVFLSYLSFLEMWYTTVTVPKMLADFLSDSQKISFNGCVGQIYFFFALGLTELFLLTAMAYDRYLAICFPLRYTSIMTSMVCHHLNVGSWVSGFLIASLLIIPVSTFDFCGPLSLDHFFCDVVALLNISCRNVLLSDILVYSLTWTIILNSLLFTMISYAYIIRTILMISSCTGQWKAFSTCASHLAVVFTFYGTVIFMYIRPTSRYASHMDKVVSVFYAVVTPLLNPMVYTLRNSEFKEAVSKVLKRSNMYLKNHCLL